MKKLFSNLALLLAFLLFWSCGGGGSSSEGGGCEGSCPENILTVQDVDQILRQAIIESNRQGVNGTIAVLDRVGNVLALYQMLGAKAEVLIDGQIGAIGGLEGAKVPSTLAAISKAGTGAYLSSQGNAFSTRTASQIIQENFDPGENNQPGGPLFGVQFSQLICSDITVLDGTSVGPRPLPLGLSADPGGFPLYKNGVVVGGIGVEIDGLYSLDRNVRDRDESLDELVAFSASLGFEAPVERRADRIFPGGKSLRFSDITEVEPLPEISVQVGDLVSLPPFTNGTIKQGAEFGTSASGLLKTTRLGIPAATLVDSNGNQRFPTTASSELSTEEVDAILDSAFFTAHQARAAIRRPLDTPARVSIWVVDTQGSPLGFVRSEDAPVFGIDVALQKARTAVFFSSTDAGQKLEALGFVGYVSTTRQFIGADALTGTTAFSNRAIANLSRPFFPDGINGNFPGSFSLPFPGASTARTWSPFNTGLQLDLVIQGLLAPLSGVIPERCVNLNSRLANGIQVFPGSVPLYKKSKLVGAIGVSGDGVDQDDLVAFYGASRNGLDQVGHGNIGDSLLGFNAPLNIRADLLSVSSLDLRLRYVNCPEAPFIENNKQNVCIDS